MKTVLSLQSQLVLAGLEGSSVTTFSMFFQVSILDMFFSATKCLQIAFLSNFGSPLGPWGVIKKRFFPYVFQLWTLLGTKCLQELPQESPEPPQASIFVSFSSLSEQILVISRYHKCLRT